MKGLIVSLVLAMFTSCSAQAVERSAIRAANDDSDAAVVTTPLLVELFTSEGCSSCPPAEALLSTYEKEQPFAGAEVVTLAFHVDYWDGLGWKDKYASALFTQRQKIYDRKFRTGKIYTPQMVVDGDYEFVGSREKDAEKAVKKALKADKAVMELSVDGGSLKISISGLSKNEQSTVFLAVAEDNLSSDVRRGENAGKNLTHLSVVRQLNGVGMIAANEGRYDATSAFQIENSWVRENLKLVVFVQENVTRNVLSVGQIRLPNESPGK